MKINNSKCPICKNILLNIFNNLKEGCFEQSCRNTPMHMLNIYYNDDNEIYRVYLWLYETSMYYYWDSESKKFSFGNYDKGFVSSNTFWEPDFYNYPKLIKQLKTYALFY